MKPITISITANVSGDLVTDKVRKSAIADDVILTENGNKVKFDFGKVPFDLPEVKVTKDSEVSQEKASTMCEAQFRVDSRAAYVDEKLASYGIETTGGKTLALVITAVKAANPSLTDEEAKEIAKTALGK